jgi:hypothetical protein
MSEGKTGLARGDFPLLPARGGAILGEGVELYQPSEGSLKGTVLKSMARSEFLDGREYWRISRGDNRGNQP